MSKYIGKNKKICGGVPVIKGTRITVSSVLGALSSGLDIGDIVKNAKKGGITVKKEEILSALSYSSENII